MSEVLSDVTRAEYCVIACAEAWRDNGEVLASPMGAVPSVGARLARLTFAPDLLLTDGEAMLVGPDGTVEGWLPYRQHLTMVTGGRRHVMMGASQIDRFGNQNISCIGDWERPARQLLGVRGAPVNTLNNPVSYWVSRHSPRVFVEKVDVICGVGYDNATAAGPTVSRYHRGADAVIVQGGEGGGHTGEVATTVLLPQVVGAVEIPVVAAGGFFDGRGLVAALAYGAAGIAMGTRFLLTSDSTVPDAVKAKYLAATVKDVTVTRAVDGLPHRMLRTDLVNSLEAASRTRSFTQALRRAAGFRKLSGLTWPAMIRDGLAMKHGKNLSWSQVLLAANTPMLLRASMVEGRTDLGVMASGQVAGVIDDLPSCAELVERVMTEAERVLHGLAAAKR